MSSRSNIRRRPGVRFGHLVSTAKPAPYVRCGNELLNIPADLFYVCLNGVETRTALDAGEVAVFVHLRATP